MTQDIISQDAQSYMGVFGTRLACLTHGQDCTLYDDNGNAYVDFLAGIAVNALGYNHPQVTAAICYQTMKLCHVSNYFYTQPQTELASRLCQATGMQKVFFANSGAEANECAFKLARRYFSKQGSPRYKIISMKGSFHGRTMCALAATGQEKYQEPFAPMPDGFVQVSTLEELTAQAHDAAAILIEPIQGENGVIPWPDGFLASVRALCDKTGALLIFDEIQTGVGRTGTFLASQGLNIKADIVTLAKALGGGLPLGACLCNAKADVFSPGEHGSTFGGNAVCCAAGNAVLDVILEENFMKSVIEKGETLMKRLCEIAATCPSVLQVRGKGLMVGMQLKEDVPGKKIVHDMMDAGYIINCAGNNTLRFVPPLIITEEEIAAMCDTLEKVLRA